MVGSNSMSSLPGKMRRLSRNGRLFVMYDAQVYALHGKDVDRVLRGVGRVSSFVIPPGERSKSRTQLSRLQDFLLSERVTREDVVVAVGGGVISDLVGYAAATTLRGIDWVVIPTTLLSMVDAAIGGKTGINHGLGKNLIGTFWQPRLVWCDTRFLMTLPDRELISGLGEVLKYAGLIGGKITEKLEDFLCGGCNLEDGAVAKLVESCIRYKAGVVELDELDTGKRMVLNFGHTFGHAVETGAGHGRLRHGEALMVGLKAAVDLSQARFPGATGALTHYARLVESFQEMVPRRKLSLDRLRDALFLDKKRGKSGPNFILLQKPGKPIITTNVKLRDVKTSLRIALKRFELTGNLDG
mgnify:CR=1 FL=1